ncbi:MAG: glycosyltransferase family 2 protein [Clostridia bacterium]|nr:glycosyltransferase family 2 protein [Clostridia bacterium]
MKNEKVSIIIPFYNAKKYISNCIDCIIGQTYKNFEVIFINDGSTDDGQEIIDKATSDNRIKLINISKSGVSEARNIGIANSTGKYLAFMDIDDEYRKNYLEVMVESIEKSNADIVLCNYIEKFKSKEVYSKLPWNDCIIYKEEILRTLLPSMIGKKNKEDSIETIRGLVWRTFIDADFYKKYNIKFNKKVPIAEDLLFLIDLYAKANKIYITSDFLYNYNRYSGTTLDKYILGCFKNQIYFHDKLIDCLKRNKIFEENKSRYAMNRLRMYTSTISNAVRNENKKETIKEIKEIVNFYAKDDYIKYISTNLTPIWKLNKILLNYKMCYTLKIIYSLKEWKRRKKLV